VTQVFSLLGFVAKLKTIEHDMNDLGPAIVARACEMVACCQGSARYLRVRLGQPQAGSDSHEKCAPDIRRARDHLRPTDRSTVRFAA
jgi:hypothetical protein